MTGKIEIKDATQESIDRFKKMLCKENHDEAWAMNHLCGECALQLSFDDSTIRKIIFYEDRPVIAFGAVIKGKPILENTDIVRQVIVWLMASYELKHVMLFAIKQFKALIEETKKKYRLETGIVFENFVDCRHEQMIKFIKLCGFDFDKPIALGKEGMLFKRFWIEEIL